MITNSKIPTDLKTHDFFYELPEELIAQTPAAKRDASRLLVLERDTGNVSHEHFSDIVKYFNEGDVLVINRSKVMPARLYGKRADTEAPVEILLLKRRDGDDWEVIVKPGKKCHVGNNIIFGNGELSAEITEVLDDGNRIIHFTSDNGSVSDQIHKLGEMPLPPYITSREADMSRYQTVYAKEEGSAAAPTAGLHFTPELLSALEAKGVKIASVLLHVGLGTFRPVKEEDIADHHMHSEWFSVSEEATRVINERKGRLIAVGTTSCRVLESVADDNGRVRAGEGETAIFIYPGYKFKAIDALITNFHLPESTLIMLVSAFAGRENVLSAYREAVKERYRFFSFGDAMLIQ